MSKQSNNISRIKAKRILDKLCLNSLKTPSVSSWVSFISLMLFVSRNVKAYEIIPITPPTAPITVNPFPTGTITPIPITIIPLPTNTPTPVQGRYIRVIQPNGGEVLTVGQTFRIRWESSKIDKVSIGYKSCPSCLDWIVNNIPNNKYYDWTVNVGNTVNTKFKIYVIGYETGKGSVTDESDNYFTVIKPMPLPTSTPTPTPTVTPTPKVEPNRRPIISTWYLPWGRLNRYYSAMVSGYDTNKNDNLSMSISNLPSGLRAGPCFQNVMGNRKSISCNVSGTPTRSGYYFVTMTLTDDKGGTDKRQLPLYVFPR